MTGRRLGLLLCVLALGVGAVLVLRLVDFGGSESEDGQIVQIDAGDRQDPVVISGDSLQGDRVDLATLRGQVVVLNVWGSWCAPCRDEAPILAEADQTLDIAMVGLLARPEPVDNAVAFEREYGITYPTVDDDGESQLALGEYAPRAPPSTYVLDRKGRVAVVISGPVPSLTTLRDLVEEVAAEDG